MLKEAKRNVFRAVPAAILLSLFLGEPLYAVPLWVSPPGGGDGSYAVTVPAEGKHSDADPGGDSGTVRAVPPAVGPNTDAPGSRKVPTADWWTPLAWLDPADLPDPAALPSMRGLSWQVFSEPLVFQPQKGGVAVSLNIPDSRRAAVKGGILTAGEGFMLEVVGDDAHGGKGISPYFNAFFDQDMYLGSTEAGWNSASFGQVKVTGWSDWFVNFSLTSAAPAERLDVTAGAGSPFLLVKTQSGRPQVTFRTWNVGKVIPLQGASFSLNAGQALAQAVPSAAFAVVNKVPYGKPQAPADAKEYATYTVYAVFGPSGSTWQLKDTQYNSEIRGPFPAWTASHAYLPGNPVEPSAANGFFYTANGAGTSGASEPAWPASAGGTVTDGTVTWTANAKELRNVLNTAECSAGTYYAVAVLPYPWGKGIYDEPDEQKVKDLLAHFAGHAFAEVTDTRVTPGYAPQSDGHDITVTCAYTTAPVGTESPAAGGPLRAMYPHQYLGQSRVNILDQSMNQVSSASWRTGWHWPSLKGPLLLASGNSFVNVLEVPPCLPAPIDAPDRQKADRMTAYLRQALDSQNPRFLSQGSYFGAQQMYRLAMLLPAAEMIRDTASRPADADQAAREMYTAVSESMAGWLKATKDGTALKNAAQHLFYYDSRWGALLPTPEDGFAADSLLNDHHFHYGYFIKIAAEIARWEKTHPDDPANRGWASSYAPMIRMLIKNIANTSREGSGADPDFPFLRHFSPYAGHSWASGSSRGNQGGQQESTPEAIQAWGAILLWSQLNYPENGENGDLERWAAYMFASEARAAEFYWFGLTDDGDFRPHLSFRQYSVKSDAVPKPYVPSMVSQVNQNEMTYQTDFGNPPLLKLGIQILPFTGSSLYLGSTPGNADAIVSGYLDNDLPKLADGGTSPSNRDKLLMLQAMTARYTADPRALITPAGGGALPLDSWKMQWEIPTPAFNNLILQDTSRGAVYWWIDTLLAHGVPHHWENDANHTSAASFLDGRGGRVYTAYNPGESPLLVTFADGNTLEVPPLAYAHETSDGAGGGCTAGAFNLTGLVLFLPLLLLLRERNR
ncbi:glycosyl hydrolase family 81 [Aminivibrio pyruvatiphilus]|uniref:glucan endo-1,3-beta-D-glucosidase n=1 Tax=Aminivibrio pyruvatiphilus TaxID=1005740 RepID=A0A4R8MC08_9BACT|nr:glycosyl hydrolase [Aminivibrio pyruvatiphilus]TDY61717.1 glycosyl hydrolase family 81 [Aminivibrio pyruvatiphilus]